MIDHEEFISNQKSIVIAPAGYGKTHLIVESLKISSGKQLILTHTHAGVAAIKERIKKSNVSAKYNVETITSFAQKYVLSFYNGTDLPEQEDSAQYYPFLIRECTKLFKISLIQRIFTRTYTGLFVDEYQDCSLIQHELITELSNHLPTRILGDPLQGIFDFNNLEIVDLDNESQFGSFNENKYQLTTPWRWKEINENLGQELDQIREKLINKQVINIEDLTSTEIKKYNIRNIFDSEYRFNSFISNLLSEKSLLIIHPDSTNLNARISFNKSFSNKFYLLESIDGKDFYKEAKNLDSLTAANYFEVLISLSKKLFNSTPLNVWFNATGVKNKRDENQKIISSRLKQKLENVQQNLDSKSIYLFYKELKELPDLSIKRKDLLNSLFKSLDDASLNKKSIYDSMLVQRNKIRVIGRKVFGKCIGTTLLTKGLEFDTVVVLKANHFDCHKNFYVAISRACKRLILCYDNNIINFDG